MQHTVADLSRLSLRDAAASTDEKFEDLVRRQSRFAFQIAYAILRNTHDSEDVVQEAFLRLYRSRSWQQMEDEKAFIARVTWRVAVRRVSKKSDSPSQAEPASSTDTPELNMIAEDRTKALHRLIDALPEDLRQPLALATVDELTSAQISTIMGIPEGTVRSRLTRARQLLKQKAGILFGRTQ